MCMQEKEEHSLFLFKGANDAMNQMFKKKIDNDYKKFQ